MSDPPSCPDCQGACASDAQAGFRFDGEIVRFNQKYDIFNRSFWDDDVRSKRSEEFFESYRKPLENWRHVDGYAQRDFALRNAGWHLADLFAERREHEDRREGFLDFLTAHRESASERSEVTDPEAAATEIKRISKLFGADLVGITYFDPRWLYSKKYSRRLEDEAELDLEEDELTSVIVVAHEMDHDLLETVPSALSGTATGIGYSRDVGTLLGIAQYIRNLGYRAYASMNDTALSIPLAIKAGLGEYGRHGLLIAPGLGPRLRLGKILTDLPLAHDRPIRFGVEDFCNVCRRCSDECPPRAIASGEPSSEVYNVSNLRNVVKWTTDAERCFGFWAKQVTDCSICVRVCPYNRDLPRWLNRVRFRLMGGFLRRWMLWLDTRFGGGRRVAPRAWWSARPTRG